MKVGNSKFHESMTRIEADALKLLANQNLISIHRAYGWGTSTLFQVIEFAKFGSLHFQLKNINDACKATAHRGVLDEGIIRLLLHDSVHCLNHMHTKAQFVSGDISPMNVLVNECGIFKLCDLGTTRPVDFSTQETVRIPVHERILNHAFVCPHFKHEGILGGFSDVFSLGKTVYMACVCHYRDVSNLVADAIEWDSREFAARMKRHPIPSHYSQVLRRTLQAMVDPDFTLRPTAEELASIRWLSAKAIECQRQRVRLTFQPVPTEAVKGLNDKYKKAYGHVDRENPIGREPIAKFDTEDGLVYTRTERMTEEPEAFVPEQAKQEEKKSEVEESKLESAQEKSMISSSEDADHQKHPQEEPLKPVDSPSLNQPSPQPTQLDQEESKSAQSKDEQVQLDLTHSPTSKVDQPIEKHRDCCCSCLLQ